MTVYLDHNATTPLSGEVLEVMLPYLQGRHGNPSSLHGFGREAREALEQAREQVAALVNAQPASVVFTGGGTEANNLALRGAAGLWDGGEIAVSAAEHVSVLAPAEALGRRGWDVREIPVDAGGRVTGDALAAALSDRTRLVSVMTANNETGVVQDIAALAAQARAHGAFMHTDAVQAAGKMTLDFRACGAHMMTLSAHKIRGPKGVGALIVDKALDLEPQVVGGGHENMRRAGTENVAGIVGFGAAAVEAGRELEARRAHLLMLRERLESFLRTMEGVELFGSGVERLPNTVCFAVPGIDGETLLINLDRAGFAVSSGSACASGSTDPSHVLLSMGVARDVARCALRVSLGTDNTVAEVDAFAECLQGQVRAIRGLVMRESA